jgi:hypothetical protein
MSELAVKVLTLAFHPSTNENEAVCAFLKARAMVPKNPDYNGFLRSGQNASTTKVVYVKEESAKKSGSWNLTIQTHKIPHLLSILHQFKSTPFYDLEVTSENWSAIGIIKITLTVFLSHSDSVLFGKYFDSVFDKVFKTK